MWGFSFDEIARRAQEEAAKLAEQASTTIGSHQGMFNLDAMHPDGPSPFPSSSSAASSSHAAASAGFSTPVASSSSSMYKNHDDDDAAARPFHTEPAKTTGWREGVAVVNPLVAVTTPAAVARKLHIDDEDANDFDDFDSWGEGDETTGEGRGGESEEERKRKEEEEEEAAEDARERERLVEKRLAAEAESARVEAERLERERLAAQAEVARMEAERDERERLAAEIEAARVEAERIERERLAAQAEVARIEAKRIEQEKLAAEIEVAREEVERIERERLAAEAESARVKAECIERERLAAETEAASKEAERVDRERLAAETEAAKMETERLERERLAAEMEASKMEAERLELERQAAKSELAREEAERLAERLELERLAAESELASEEAERLELERLAAEMEAANMEAERLAAEAEVARKEAEHLERERLAAKAEAARVEAEFLEEERLAAEAEAAKSIALEEERLVLEEAMEVEASERAKQAELDRLKFERIEREAFMAEEVEAQRLERETFKAGQSVGLVQDKIFESPQRDKLDQQESHQNDHTEALRDGGGNDDIDGLYNNDEFDDMYGDDDSDDEPDEDHSNHVSIEVKESNTEENNIENNVENDQNSQENTVSVDENPAMPEKKPEQSHSDEESLSLEPATAETSFFDAAAAATSMFQSSKLFEVSKSASMFSWGYNVSNETPAEMIVPVSETALNTITEIKSDNPTELSGQVREGVETVTTLQVKKADDQNSSGTPSLNEQHVPQHMLDKFMHQLERITESHQLELDELQRTHTVEIDRLTSELLNERENKKKSSARDDVASQDKFLKQMRDLEKKFAGTIKEQESELRNVKQRNSEMELKLNTLNRDVSKLTKIVDERDDEICKLKQGYGNTMMQVEGQVKTRTEEIYKKDNEIYELKKSVSSLQAELDTTADAYNTLKARAKAVASELKDRRIEVRTLSSRNEELASSNASFETQLSNLRALVNQHELTIVYKDKDIDTLNEKIKEMGKEIEKGKDRSLQDRSVGEKAIASYKRKAQEALAAANARLAAANQAREEAESDAKNARSASDDAVERARVAEIKRSEAELKASKVNAQLEFEQMASSKDISQLKEFVESLKDTVSSLRAELEDATEKRVELVAELEQLNSDLSEQKEKNADLRDHMIQTNIICESLQKEVSDLNEEVQRSSAVAFKRAKDNGEASIVENHADIRSFSNLSVNGVAMDRQESDGTIIMLQQELQGANEAIAELKLALRTALLERADNDYARDKTVSIRGAEALHGGGGSGGGGESNTGNESTPLFFAIEKQNELKTARDEINRLANMLGDAECSKQEAYDAMEDMRQKMEEANSRLLRYERLGMKSARTQNSHHSNYGPFRSNALGGHSAVLGDDLRTLQAGSDSSVNLEYLKNIMLSFLTATTLADRRKLVPVVATVLCLTPEEQAQAIRSVERTAGLTGVASSFWENIESKAHNLTGI